MNYADMSPKERSNAYKLVQFVCTHLNVTCFMASHSWVQLIPRLRRACNVVVMWPPTHGGAEQLSYISRSLGLPKPLLEDNPRATTRPSLIDRLGRPIERGREFEGVPDNVQGPVDVRRPDHEQFEQGTAPLPIDQRPDRKRDYLVPRGR